MRSHTSTYDINFEFQSPLRDSNVATFLPQRTAPIRDLCILHFDGFCNSVRK